MALPNYQDIRPTSEDPLGDPAGLRFFESACRELKLEIIPSAANFFLVKVGEGQRVFEALQREGVITRPMGGYQLPEYIRISIGTPAENERCLAALKRVLNWQETT